MFERLNFRVIVTFSSSKIQRKVSIQIFENELPRTIYVCLCTCVYLLQTLLHTCSYIYIYTQYYGTTIYTQTPV